MTMVGIADLSELLRSDPARIVTLLAAVFLSTLLLRKLLSKSGQHGFRLPPGPRPFPILGNLPALGSCPHQSLAKLAKTYGPLMYLRLGSVPTFVASSAEMAELVLKTQDKAFSSRPKVTSNEIICYGSQNFAFLLGDEWRSARKLFTEHIVTAKRIENTQTLRKEEIFRILRTVIKESEAVDSTKGHGVPMFNQFFQMSTNIITRMTFSRRMFSSSDMATLGGNEFRETVVEVFRLFGIFNIGDFIPALKPFDLQGFQKQMRAVQKRLDSILQGLVDARWEELRMGPDEGKPKDFLTTLLTQPTEQTGKPLTEDQVKGMLVDVLLAAIDTSAITLEWAFSELLKNPAVLRKCVEELDTVVGQSRLVEEADLRSLPYVQAVVKETFRLHPAGPLMLPHFSTADCKVGDYFVPAHSRIMVNVWAIGRDPAVWDRVDDFYPDRFLPDQMDAAIDVHGRDFKLLPFGSGRRQCPGKNLALKVVQTTLAVLLHSCDWSLPSSIKPDEQDMSEKFALGVSRAVKLEAIATPRLPASVMNGLAEENQASP